MDHLDGVSTADLRDALAEIEGSRASTRLIAAIAYRQDVSQTELAEWFDVERKTVYNWLTRIEERPDALAKAARDEPRPGRPSKMTDEQQAALAESLASPPGASGYDEPEWSPSFVREHVSEEFDVDYTLATCRRLLVELGEG